MTSPTAPVRIDIWHNILWSQYKGEVFSSLYEIAPKNEFDFHFYQIAETEGNRIGLSTIDLTRHRYPFTLLFKGAYETPGVIKRLIKIAKLTWNSDAKMAILTGYEKPEVWLQLFILTLRRRKVAIFCDSTIYDQKQHFLKGLLKTLFFKSVQGVFGYGTRSREYVVYYGADPRRVYFRCQAAALPFGYSEEAALAQRLQNAPSIEAPRFLYVGRLSPEKGLAALISAFAGIRAHYKHAKLIIVGQGPMNDKLEQQVRTLGLSDAVEFAGSKSGPDLFMEYSKATAFVLPSTSEPWGLVVNEALSYGCPVVVSHKCGCVPELVQDGVTGYVHRTDDMHDLAEKMTLSITSFKDIETTAQECLHLMRKYTPDKAAENILAGVSAILTNNYEELEQ